MKYLKKMIFFFGIVSISLMLCFLILLGSIYLYYNLKGSDLDKKSKLFVDKVTVEIFKDWNLETYIQNAAPEVMINSNIYKMEKVFQTYSRLGNLQKFHGSRGESHTTLQLWPPFSNHWIKIKTTAGYVIYADFSAGSAKVDITVLKKNEKWFITGFHVDMRVDRPTKNIPKDIDFRPSHINKIPQSFML